MAITLQDESKVIEFLEGNTSPTPVIIGKGGMFAVANYSSGGDVQLYKRDLLTTNSDYLVVDKDHGWANLFDVDIEITATWNNVSGSSILWSAGDNSSASTGYIRLRSNDGITAFLQYGFNTTAPNAKDESFPMLEGEFNFSFKNGVAILNGVTVLTLTDQVLGITEDNIYIGALWSNIWHSNSDIKNLTINGEYFGLNESSGALITGSLGTTGTCITSNASPTYIDDVMIQPILPEYKRVLLAVNLDRVTINNVNTWATWGDVNLEFNTDLTNVGNTENIISFGTSSGDKFRLTRWTTGVFRGQLTIDSITTDLSVTWTFSSLVNIKIINGIVKVNDVDVLDFSARNADLLFAFPSFHFGSLSYSTTLWPSNQEVHNAKFGGEYFGLNEPSGALITGSLGTTGTCITSNASPTYIDDVMIQPIN